MRTHTSHRVAVSSGNQQAEDALAQRQDLDKSVCEVVRELVKQILTLSTSLIAAGVAYAKVFENGSLPEAPFLSAICCFVLTIVFGLLTLMAMISTLANGSFDVARNAWIAALAALHCLSFIGGLFCCVWLTAKVIGG